MSGQVSERNANLSGLECIPPGTIKIKDFKGGKDWKVVIGKEFKYEGDPKLAGMWKWEIGKNPSLGLNDNWNTTFTPKLVLVDEHKGKGIIPFSDLPDLNSDLGDARGKVEVTNSSGDKGAAVVKVFFMKDDLNLIHAPTEPNWFYYWKQSPIVQSLLNISGIHLYDLSTCSFQPNPTQIKLNLVYAGSTYPYAPYPASNTYGVNYFDIYNMNKEDLFDITKPKSCKTINDPLELAITGYKNAAKIEIGQGCGFQKATDICNPITNIEGIHTFYSTVVHEVEHAIITCEVWNFTDPNDPTVGPGYLLSYDEDKDGYKDLWETKGSHAGYIFTVDPSGIIKDQYVPSYQGCYCSKSCSAGTQYEEERCRSKEAPLNTTQINPYDWSFDQTTTHQGKQWK